MQRSLPEPRAEEFAGEQRRLETPTNVKSTDIKLKTERDTTGSVTSRKFVVKCSIKIVVKCSINSYSKNFDANWNCNTGSIDNNDTNSKLIL